LPISYVLFEVLFLTVAFKNTTLLLNLTMIVPVVLSIQGQIGGVVLALSLFIILEISLYYSFRKNTYFLISFGYILSYFIWVTFSLNNLFTNNGNDLELFIYLILVLLIFNSINILSILSIKKILAKSDDGGGLL
jgi:hypothetical protein